MTDSNAVMVLILAAMNFGCSSQRPSPESAATIPQILLRVIDADTGKPLEHVIVSLQKLPQGLSPSWSTDANGELKVEPPIEVGNRLGLLFTNCDPDGTIVDWESRDLRLGPTAASEKYAVPAGTEKTIKPISYGEDYSLVVTLKRGNTDPPDTLGQQFISETKFLKRGMSIHDAFSLLEAHGFRESNEGRAGTIPHYFRALIFTSDRYPDRYLDLRFDWLSPPASKAVPRPQEDYLLRYWEVTSRSTHTVTHTRTTDPAVWKASIWTAESAR